MDKRRNLKVSDDTLRRLNRIAKREQRTQTVMLDRIILQYDQQSRRAEAARINQEEATA